MDYEGLFSSNLPLPVEMPAGLQPDTKYGFSVTYADRCVFPTAGRRAAHSPLPRPGG